MGRRFDQGHRDAGRVGRAATATRRLASLRACADSTVVWHLLSHVKSAIGSVRFVGLSEDRSRRSIGARNPTSFLRYYRCKTA